MGVPRSLTESAIVPILKDQSGDTNDPDNRGIAISSTLRKMLGKQS